MHYFSNKISKIAKRWRISALSVLFLNFDFGDLAKLWCFKLIMTKSNLKNIVMTSFQ